VLIISHVDGAWQVTPGNSKTSRKSPVGMLRTSFRENGKMKHTQHGRITGCSLKQLKILQLAFRVKPGSEQNFC
jgi:hypothetical protein